MKKVVIICFCLFVGYSYGQNKTVDIDYTVDYIIPNKRNKANDTVSIGFNKDGKYLWTNYNALAISLAKSMIKNHSEDFKNAKSNIIYDTENGDLTLAFEFTGNLIFFNLNLNTLLPQNRSNNEENNLSLITEDLGETINVLGKDVDLYNMFPSENPDDVITIATDKNFKMNNSLIFNKILEIAYQKSGIEDKLPNVPNGLIMKVIEKDNTLIEAIKVEHKKKTINFNYSFKITE
jgi:hypothetical protein